MNPEIEIKTTRIAEMLRREGLAAVLLNSQYNFAWLTGGASNGVDESRDNGVASVLISAAGHRYLLASVIEMSRMLTEQVNDKEFEPIEFAWQEEKGSGTFLIDTAKSLVSGEVATDIFMHPSFRCVEGKIAPCRHELTASEVERFRELGKDTAGALVNTIKATSPGETERQIAGRLRNQLCTKNIDPVVTLVAADERISLYRHPVPTEKVLQNTLLLVTCAKREGLIASVSRIGCWGDASPQLRIRTEAAAFVNASLLNATRPGTTGAELYRVAANAYSERGFPGEIGNHHQGGAAGYRTREWVAHPNCSEIVRNIQAFAWNPTIAGTKVEDTVIVTDEAIECITETQGFPVITTKIDGSEFRSADILLL